MSDLVPIFPHILASLNFTTVILLIFGVRAVRRGERAIHKKFMLAVMLVAILFLIIYTLYHLEIGNAVFAGTGKVRWVYFTLLIAHILAAVIVLFIVPMTLARALRSNFTAHKALAKKALPLWMFVSISGLVVYIMAFHIWPVS
ncbi:MAG: DUF420 domain-containing protein [Magnetococcales bacterium]|nr:DUF420 domain-containing protein [Magnetococcales bacterium]